MKVVKHGKFLDGSDTKKFICNYCGCVFEADRDEYSYDFSIVDYDCYFCECPECGFKVIHMKENSYD